MVERWKHMPHMHAYRSSLGQREQQEVAVVLASHINNIGAGTGSSHPSLSSRRLIRTQSSNQASHPTPHTCIPSAWPACSSRSLRCFGVLQAQDVVEQSRLTDSPLLTGIDCTRSDSAPANHRPHATLAQHVPPDDCERCCYVPPSLSLRARRAVGEAAAICGLAAPSPATQTPKRTLDEAPTTYYTLRAIGAHLQSLPSPTHGPVVAHSLLCLCRAAVPA